VITMNIDSEITTTAPEGLVDGPRLLERLFPNKDCRPSVRWLRTQQKRQALPFVKIGRLVFFDPPSVRAAILDRTVRARGRAGKAPGRVAA
jgi:hypothetical protein